MLRLTPALVVALSCCSQPPAPDAGVEDAGIDDGACCTRWGLPEVAGQLGDPELNELSGLVASRAHPGVLYGHNDSGDSARFFALSTTGAALGRFTLEGATANDIEDIALGPCDAGTCLWLGDIGDNMRHRDDYAVYRVPEPQLLADAGTAAVPWERFAWAYPDGEKNNSEALLANPVTGRLYLVTKERTGPSRVYRFPLPLDGAGVNVLELVTTLTVPGPTDAELTAADVSPCGRAVLLRMYNRLVELRLPAGETDFERIFDVTPVPVAVADDPQGESVAYSADGRSFYTSSEWLAEACLLHVSACR